MNKSQQMRWTRRGADLLLQVRCAVYNGTLGSGFGQRFEPVVGLPPEMAMGSMTPRFWTVPGTALTEATANFLVNRRMNKSQQMRWTRRGADLLL